MKITEARFLATKYLDLLQPYCERIDIAGSIRRNKLDDIKDVELVAIPKPYETGLFATGIAKIVDEWEAVKGQLGPACKYTQRILPEGVKLDLFFATPKNWGLILLIRTGDWQFSKYILGAKVKDAGYYSKDGILYWKDKAGTEHPTPVREEIDLFNLLGAQYIEPENRDMNVRLTPKRKNDLVLGFERKDKT